MAEPEAREVGIWSYSLESVNGADLFIDGALFYACKAEGDLTPEDVINIRRMMATPAMYAALKAAEQAFVSGGVALDGNGYQSVIAALRVADGEDDLPPSPEAAAAGGGYDPYNP